MYKLLTQITERFLRSFFETIPNITESWFVIYRVAFYAGAVVIYILTYLVLVSVVLIILLIAQPVSYLYRHDLSKIA